MFAPLLANKRGIYKGYFLKDERVQRRKPTVHASTDQSKGENIIFLVRNAIQNFLGWQAWMDFLVGGSGGGAAGGTIKKAQ